MAAKFTGLRMPLFIVLLWLAAVPVQADQNDPRLDLLFEQLKASPDPAAARSIESRIWAIWQHSDDRDVAALMLRGIAAMNRGEYDAALEVFGHVVEQAPQFAEGWNKRATVHYLRGEYAASMRDVQRTLALEPRHFGALSGMGLIFMATGDDEGALQAFEEVLRIAPQAEDTRQQIRRLRRKLRDELI